MMRSGPHPAPLQRLSRWLLWLSLVLLLSAQGLGQVHRIAHAQQPDAARHQHDEGWGHASGSADCQILDHLAHDCGPVPLPALAAAALPLGWMPAAAPQAVFLSARWSRGARAPPLQG
ncbi:MAG TPA: hypothetical protein VJN44_20380 [Roseateles sp.]|nr:hypothetical protein [Roseateles sp.]